MTGLQFTVTVGALHADTFAVVKFTLDEQLGHRPLGEEQRWAGPFQMLVDVVSAQSDVGAQDVLDLPCELVVWFNGEVQRRVSGVVSMFEQRDTGFRRTHYRLEVRPALWRLSLRHNCRIFQQQTPPDIISILLKEMGIVDVVFALRHNHPAREYCVQYRESDQDFVTRLATEEGIFVYHEFEQGIHRLVFADDVCTLADTPIVLPYNLRPASLNHGAAVQQFAYTEAVRPSQVVLKDYDFTRPHYDMLHQREPHKPLQHQREAYEHFDSPGRYQLDDHGKALTSHHLDALRQDATCGRGKSNCAALAPGRRVTLQDHPDETLAQRWQVVEVHHEGKQPQALEEEGDNGATTYHNAFLAIDARQTWRNLPIAPPRVAGPQSAKVVGPADEEIYCDEYGRIKVQFPWDRYGASNEQSSCWIRVSQQWAGGQYGAMAIPRVGHEVIVSFLEGDPDRPLVTGCTYHAANRPPYPLPENKTRTVLRTQTHQGKGFNELRFEDNASQEEIYIHGQKDLNALIQNDAAWHVKHDEHTDIDNQRVTTIKANDHLTVEGEKRDHIKGDYSLRVDTDLHQRMGQSLLVEAGQEIHLYAGDKVVLEAGSEISAKVGGSFIKIDPSGVTVLGPTIKLNSGGKPGIGTQSAPHLPERSKLVAQEMAPAEIEFDPVAALLTTPPVLPVEEEEEEEESPLSILRIGVFFDGTSNNTANHLEGQEAIEAFLAQCEDPGEQEKLRQRCLSGEKPVATHSQGNDMTNIGKMHELYLRDSRESLTVPVYISGIGTEDGEEDDNAGGGFDFYFNSSLSKVELACRTLIAKEVDRQLGAILPTLGPIQKIEFDVFGFSRGASAARQFVNTIDQQGNHLLVGAMAGLSALTLKHGFNWASREDVRIRFVGLFDTVVTSQIMERDITLAPDCADRVVHLIAKDEWRMNFASTRITDDVQGTQIAPNFTELIIPGSHSDVGGGYYSRWSVADPSTAAPVLTENKVVRSFVGYEPVGTPVDHTQTYRQAWDYANALAQQGWARGIKALSSPTSQPVLGQVNIRASKGRAASLGAGTLGISQASSHVQVDVILRRVVEGEYSRIPLHMMMEAARAAGVPFEEWDSTDPNLKLVSAATPPPRVDLAKLDAYYVDAGKQAGVAVDLTTRLHMDAYQQLRFTYLHYSADTGLVNYPNIKGGEEVRRVVSNQEGGH